MAMEIDTLESLAAEAEQIHSPDAVFYWEDSKPTGAVGWVVLDRVINRVAGGGIFMHPNATEEEVADIARNMSRKFTVCDPQIGGAKAGIRFNHRDARAKEVLRRFITDNKTLLSNVWVTAGDLNTDDRFIEKVIQNDLGLPTMQHVLAQTFSRATGQPNRAGNLASIIIHPACKEKFFPLIEGSVGYGIAEGIRTAIKLTNPGGLGQFRVIIQGFGAVGSSLAYYLVDRNIAKVVALCDKDGYIFDHNGLDITEILCARQARIQKLMVAKASPKRIAESAKNFFSSLSSQQKKRFNAVSRTQKFSIAGNAQFLAEFLACTQAEVFSPCALRYQVSSEIVQSMLNTTWKNIPDRYLVCGANNPYGTLTSAGALVNDDSGSVQRALRDANVCIVPDWVANSGTAQLFHRSISLNFNLNYPNLAEEVLESVGNPIRTYIEKSFALVDKKKRFLEYGCCKRALELLEKPVSLFESFKNVTNPANSRYSLPPPYSTLTVDDRLKRCTHWAVECSGVEELKELLRISRNPVALDGCEPSGRMTIAQILTKKYMVQLLTAAGFTYLFLIADWFAYMNHKLGGDKSKIKIVGKYFIEVFKASGLDLSRVQFLWASEEQKKHSDKYWAQVIDVSTKFNLADVKDCSVIMGREPTDDLSASMAMYTCMQAADALFLGADVCQMGTDQSKVIKMARAYCDKTGDQYRKPIVLANPIISDLNGKSKMSKSREDTAIFVDDSPAVVQSKVMNAYCPERQVNGNPCAEMMQYLVFPNIQTRHGNITRSAVVFEMQNGKRLELTEVQGFINAYTKGIISAADLRRNLIREINRLLEPIRMHFAADETARELLLQVQSFSGKSNNGLQSNGAPNGLF